LFSGHVLNKVEEAIWTMCEIALGLLNKPEVVATLAVWAQGKKRKTTVPDLGACSSKFRIFGI
jgi:hypothetical protein